MCAGLFATGALFSATVLAEHSGPLVPLKTVTGSGTLFCGQGSGGNPGLGYQFEYKYDSAIPEPIGPTEITLTSDPAGGPDVTVVIEWDGTFFSFDSEVPVSAALIKPGGVAGDVYAYEFPPLNPQGLWDPDGAFPGPTDHDNHLTKSVTQDISHVAFCVDPSLVVSKTAAGTFDRTYEWTIDKSATPESADVHFNDSQAFDFDIDVASNGFIDSNFEATGTISIENPFNGFDATGLVVSDVLNDGTDAAVDCNGATTVAGGQTLECSYTASPADATADLNTATADYTMAGQLRTSSGTAAVAWTANEVNGTVNVTDTFDGGTATPLGSCSTGTSPCSFQISQTLDCSSISASQTGDSGSKTNLATIAETGQTDDATVTLTCHEIDVTKTANAEFERQWFWQIDKQLIDPAGGSPLTVSEDQTLALTYQITVDLDADTPFSDSDWAVTGDITVDNPAPIPATINSLADVFETIDATIDCGDTVFPATIAANGSLTCSYSIGLDAATDGTNTATATQQNYAFASDASKVDNGTTDYSGTAAVAFGDPTSLVDDCIYVTDHLAVDGVYTTEDPVDLGKACQGDDPLPRTFTQSIERTWFVDGDSFLEKCAVEVINTASFGGENPAESTVEVLINNSDCDPGFGCTLTPGYWKTHSNFGPAPYDENWLKVGDPLDFDWPLLGIDEVCDGTPEDASCGEDTPFFLSGASWHDALWTPPAGNAYYIAAHAYIAATLNFLNGASSDEAADEAWEELTAAFKACEDDQIFSLKGGGKAKGKPSDDQPTSCGFDRSEVIGWAGTLDQYNNGYIGPGHCDEDLSSAN